MELSEEKKERNYININIDSPRKKRTIDQIGDRMKGYEKKSQVYLDDNLPAIARIDGHCFSMWTKGFKKPGDERLHIAMMKTTEDLMHKFQMLTGYTQSDEITLIFPLNSYEENNSSILKSKYIFAGKVQKIASVLASYATIRFTCHLLNIFEKESSYEDKCLHNKIRNMEAHFDARVFNVPDKNEVLNNILWRSKFDCVRNSISSLARCYYKSKALIGVSTLQMKEKLLNEMDIDWNDKPSWYKYGTFVKRKLVEVEINRKIVTRGRTVPFVLEPMDFSQENIDFIFNRYAE